jgi:hypothetical protein
MPTLPGGPGTRDSPGRGRVHVVGAPKKVSTTAGEVEPKSTTPFNVVLTGVVAGGAGVELVTRQPVPVFWVPAVRVAVTAPESASVPRGSTEPLGAPELEAGTAPQLVDARKRATTAKVPRTAIERIRWSG